MFTPATDAGGGMFYDRPLKRWVPYSALSPDGSNYAYVDGDAKSSRLHLVDVRTTTDLVLVSGGPWRVVGLQPDAVYVMRIEYLPESPAFGVVVAGHGLWKVPLTGGVGVQVQLTNDGREWLYVAAGAAWGAGSTLDVAGGPNDIVRLDLQTLKVTTWFDTGKRSRLLAVDSSGAALILTEAADIELWRVSAPGSAVKVWSGPAGGPRPYYPVAVDGGVVWFSSANQTPTWSIYRYSATGGLELVADFSDHPVTVAGPCA